VGELRELALFAGAGGGILGGALLGWRTVCAVEINPYCQRVLLARQADGMLPNFPIWDDVQTFDGHPWRGLVDVISGGFPCQDISVAGRGAGIEGERSGLWAHFARIIREVAPRYVFVENSPALVHRGLGRVLGDLAALGYDARWGVLGADDVGAPHKRERLWIRGVLADTHSSELRTQQVAWPECEGTTELAVDGESQHVADAVRERGAGLRVAMASPGEAGQRRQDSAPHGNPWSEGDPGDPEGGAEPRVGRVADGVARRVDRLKAIGNGQVPLVAATAWRLLGGEE